jgi:hypothetical protein
MIWITWFTLIMLVPAGTPAPPAITLQETYWVLDACEVRIPAMMRLIDTLAPVATVVDGAACVPVPQPEPEEAPAPTIAS